MLMLKGSKGPPSKLALDIVKRVLERRGPLETKQIWALTQEIQPSPAELQQNKNEMAKLKSTEVVGLLGSPANDENATGTSSALSKKGLGRQSMLAKMKMDNGHPVKSISYLKQLILPFLAKQAEIEKIRVKQKVRDDENAAKHVSTTSEERQPQGNESNATHINKWLWKLRQTPTPQKVQTVSQIKLVEEVLGKSWDWNHLNRRKRRRRMEKIEQDVKWAMQLSSVKAQSRVEKAKENERVQAVHRIQAKKETKTLMLKASQSRALPPPSAAGEASPSASTS